MTTGKRSMQTIIPYMEANKVTPTAYKLWEFYITYQAF